MITHKELEAALGDFVESLPALGLLVEVARLHRAKVFMTGGTIRDLVLLGKPASEVDVVIEVGEGAYSSIWNQFNKVSRERGVPGKGYTYDPMRADDAVKFVRAFDVTVNSLLFDLETKTLHDPTSRALKDLNARELFPCSPMSLLPNSYGLMRVFRLSASLDCKISTDAKNLISDYPQLIRLFSRSGDSLVLAEFLKFLSARKVEPQVKLMVESGVLGALIPELTFSIKHDANRLLKLQRIADSQINTFSTADEEVFLKRRQVRFELDDSLPLNKDRTVLSFNRVALARLALLFWHAGSDLLSIEPGLEESEPKTIRKKLETGLLSTFLYRVSYDPEVRRVFSAIGSILPKARKLLKLAPVSDKGIDPVEKFVAQVVKLSA